MRALVWTGPRQMELQEVPEPEAQTGEVRLRVGANGVCGSDLGGYLGQNSLRVPPLIMGHEFVGVVDAVGPAPVTLGSSEAAQLGQRVVVNPLISCGTCDLCMANRPNLCRKRQIIGIHRPGGLADFVAVPAAQCYLVPPQLDDLHASLVEPLACGIRAVTQARITRGEGLLILGAGPIGLLCLVAARNAGAGTIAVTDTSPERLQVASKLGATATIQVGQDDVLSEAQRLTGGLGFTAAIDAVGLDSTRNQAIRAVRPGGRVVFIGLHHENSEVEANYVVRQEIEIAGAFAYLPHEFSDAVSLLGKEHTLGQGDWVAMRDLRDGAAVFADLIAGQGGYVKVALRPGKN